MTIRRVAVLLVFIIAGISFPMAAAPEIVDQWADTRIDASIERVLVLAIVEDRLIRDRFEERMASHLKARDLQAIVGRSLVDDLAGSGNESRVMSTLAIDTFDAVVVIRPLPVKKGKEPSPYAAWQASLDDRHGVSEFVRSSLPLANDSGKRLSLELTIWARESKTPLFAARTSVHRSGTFRDNISDLMQQFIFSMRVSKAF